MTDRIRIRVQMDGKESKRELMCDQMKVADMSFADVVDVIIAVTKGLHKSQGDVSFSVGSMAFNLSFIEAIVFSMQATSSLRF